MLRLTILDFANRFPPLQSSLLMALLGEIPLTSGNVSVKGRVGYASQQPWIFSGTVRENIVFGQDFDEARYWKVVAACALKKVSEGAEVEAALCDMGLP